MSIQTTVCVTGASGFIAGQTIRELLACGFSVRGTVRGEVDDSGYAYLGQLPGAAERLALVAGDLTQPGSFDSAIAGCDYVIHAASPYLLETKNPQQDLVDPALNGTLDVLRACAKSSSVKRVVLTSSLAAITDEPDSEHVFTESDWNSQSSLSRNAYFFSKALAEQAAWNFMREGERSFDLVALNPCMVIGEALGPGLNSSNQVICDLLSGTYPGIMALNFCMVDVCDVARAHVLALDKDDAEGRYICFSEAMTMGEIVDFLRAAGYSNYRLPRHDMRAGWISSFVKLLSYTQPSGAGDFIRSHLGKTMRISNAKICAELGMEFRPVRETLLAAVEGLIRQGHLQKS
ncbi:MAG: NAD-dependent epimerase/dehydratase family protein [Gammaproteobacteria bacterium]|nr:NAD-dependent epimerase/dehydratase family protein [Gammaproteobacteria bacterium]MBQ0839317.1 NAD-dependent epimerase/dehydratase family protein [Gammaproteobacteria bacterium]